MNIEAFFKLSYGLYVVSSGDEKKYNAYIANTVFQVTAEPPQLAVVCNKDNLTASVIQKSKGFSVSVLKQETKPETLGLFGFQSGKNVNKFENIHFITGEETGIPIVLEDTIAWFECELVQQFDVGSHLIFVGRIVNNDLITKEEPLTYAYYHKVKNGRAPKNAPTYQEKTVSEKKTDIRNKKYKCLICGHVYDPDMGDPESGIPPGTAFEDLPDDWACPVCGAEKENFVEV